MTNPQVVDALRQLVALEGDCQELVRNAREQLRACRMQRPTPIVALGLADVDRALQLYEEGLLSGEQLQEWAEVLEMYDYVEYERDAEEAIASLLFDLSSPEINEPITPALARRMRASVQDPQSGG